MTTFDVLIKEKGYSFGTREFHDHLRFDRDIRLTTFPNYLKIGGSFNVIDCSNLITLPEELIVGWSFYLTGAVNLTHLPEKMKVGYCLDLEGCANLTTLPESLTSLKGFLDLSDTQIAQVPDTLRIGGMFWTMHNVGIPGELINRGIVYRGGTLSVENPDYAHFRDVFLKISNSEIRRRMIDFIGPEHTAKMLDAIEFRKGYIGNEQVRILRSREEDLQIEDHHYWVEVRCPSTHRMYMLPVPPNRTESCVDAVAYTFGLTGEEYAPLIET